MASFSAYSAWNATIHPAGLGDRYFWGHNLYFLYSSEGEGEKINRPWETWGDHCIKSVYPAVPPVQNLTENKRQANVYVPKEVFTESAQKSSHRTYLQLPLATFKQACLYDFQVYSTLEQHTGRRMRRCSWGHVTAKWNQSWQLHPKGRDQNKPNQTKLTNRRTTEKQTAGLRSTRVWGHWIWERPDLPSSSSLAYRAICKRCSSEIWRPQRDSVRRSSKTAGQSWTPGGGQSSRLCPSADATIHQSSPLHSALLNEASLIKRPCWLKKKKFFF